MVRISGSTFKTKMLFPAIWFGGIAFMFFVLFSSGIYKEAPIFIVVFSCFGVLGFLGFKKDFWNSADEVIDEGNFLLFRKGDEQQRILIEDITEIRCIQTSWPARVIIKFRSDSGVFKKVQFNPPTQINPFTVGAEIKDLIRRIDDAKHT